MIKVLMISNSYPNNINSNSGIFVHEQAKALKNKGCEVEIISPLPKQIMGLNKSFNMVPNEIFLDDIKIHFLKYRMFPGKYGHSISTINFTNSILKNINGILEKFQQDL